MIVDAILRHAKLYDLFQHVVGGYRARRHYVDHHIRPASGMRVLDIGCGTGEMLDFFPPETTYVGLDPSPEYIRAASERFGDRGTFICSAEGETEIPHWGAFDVVHSTGVLHHVDDDEALRLLAMSREAMHEEGRFYTLDGCVMESNNAIEAAMLRLDRGKHMRTEEAYEALARQLYPTILSTPYRRLFFPLPYPCVVMECKPT